MDHRGPSGLSALTSFVSALPLGAALMDRRGVILAVSEGSLARRSLQRSQVVGHPGETLFGAVVEAIPSMVSVQDYDSGALVRVNRAVESFVGLPREEVLGHVVRMRRIDGSRPGPWDGRAIASRAAHIEEIFDGEGRP